MAGAHAPYVIIYLTQYSFRKHEERLPATNKGKGRFELGGGVHMVGGYHMYIYIYISI